MKCPTCESCEYEQYCGATEIMRKCERHNKKVEQTNEEWLRSATTEQLAEWMFRFRHNYRHTLSDADKMEIEDIAWWLKQPHTPKE